MKTMAVISKFLEDHGRLQELHVGPSEPVPLTNEERARLLGDLRDIARRNAAIVWAAVFLVTALAAASFAVAAAVGGAERMGYLSGIAAALCVPIGLYLKSLWQAKVTAEALLAILPFLPRDEWFRALERLHGGDTDDPRPERDSSTSSDEVPR